MQRVEDNEEIIERVAAIDVGKAEVVVCIRIPDPARPGRRQQEIVHSSTLTPRLLKLADRLCELGVTRVVMEATSDYWKPSPSPPSPPAGVRHAAPQHQVAVDAAHALPWIDRRQVRRLFGCDEPLRDREVGGSAHRDFAGARLLDRKPLDQVVAVPPFPCPDHRSAAEPGLMASRQLSRKITTGRQIAERRVPPTAPKSSQDP
jgi:hypothetical protein